MAIAALGQLNIQEPPQQWWCRGIDSYRRLDILGEGSYGQVFKAREIGTGKTVAVKKLLITDHEEKEGFPITAIREIKILTNLHHDNVLGLKEIVTDYKNYKGNTYLVFEYMEHDLASLSHRYNNNLKFATQFTATQIKCYMRQLLSGLSYCHANNVIHRDIKCANVLINHEGDLKIADFGLARWFVFKNCDLDHLSPRLTNKVVTLWYRPPELLLGATSYDTGVDMWSVGCVFAELLIGRAVLCGTSEADQLKKIIELCGAPDQDDWPGASELPLYDKFRPNGPARRRIRDVFRGADRYAIGLLERMLMFDPSKRISARDALNAKYFWTDPLPCNPRMLPKYEPSLEYNNIKHKKQQQQQRKQPRDGNGTKISIVASAWAR
ncbi:Cell division protein kinase, putative [Ricinus communis]|uniref:Cell division protein kinase, putative n=1 Tax=Ricinus communis TaxID=3988 RepID=B9T4R4_RICCO|nr:Cell division protein kinase, putative [Ricinus communis]